MNRRRTLLVGWGVALFALGAFASLGAWQLSRMHQKQAMLDATRQVLAERRALPLSAARDAARARGYDWAEGTGAFAPAPAILLDNQSRGDRPGVRVYRLFRDTAGTALLVELGWLPVEGDRRMPAVTPIAGEQRIRGLLLPPPSPGLVARVAVAQPDGTILATSLDADSLPGLLGLPQALPPRVLRLDPALRLGYARDLDVLPNTLPPQRHLGYAVQWFALAAAVLATALLLTFRKARKPR